MGCNVGLKEGQKDWTNDLEFVELIAKKTIEQPTINQNEMKIANTLIPNNIVPLIIEVGK